MGYTCITLVLKIGADCFEIEVLGVGIIAEKIWKLFRNLDEKCQIIEFCLELKLWILTY